MMTTASMPQLHCNSTLPQPQLGLFGSTIASTPSSATTPSSLCSTPVTMLNPNFPALVQYMQPTTFPYAQPSLAPTATPTSVLPPNASIFEGVPIFLVPQNGLGSANVSLSALQKVSVSQTIKEIIKFN
ncbi:unnamed protein product [Enterobius vermicularis]|uniref:Ecto-NOX disulfide-thiol exchanger 2 n=1 Tax=Enterobius vermicularis TaxID=51028 RepID=A0A0N4VR27_ENTVE|nr:unnamed protein product [Enterobius vermicularis]